MNFPLLQFCISSEQLPVMQHAAVRNFKSWMVWNCDGQPGETLGPLREETPIGAVEESSLDVLDRIDTTYGDWSKREAQ